MYMPQGMEEETRRYLLKVLNSLAIGLLWMMINVLIGLYFGLGIITGKLSISNGLYYVWFVASLGALLYYYYRLWSKKS